MPLPGMGGMTAQQLDQQVAQSRRGDRNPQTKWQKYQAQGGAQTTKPQPSTDRPTIGSQQVAMQPAGAPPAPTTRPMQPVGPAPQTTRPSQPVPGMPAPAMPLGPPQPAQEPMTGLQPAGGSLQPQVSLPAFGAPPQLPIPQKPAGTQLGAMMRGY